MHDTDVAAVGALIGDPSRARMLDALMAGRALTAGELARAAGVTASTASEHLARLRDGGLVEVVVQGRHHYHRITGPRVGAALEALAHVAPPQPVRSLRQAGHAQALGFARTCYDHLAGVCGVALHGALLSRAWLTRAYDVTPLGRDRFAGWGVDVDDVRSRRRSFARPCLDWTERRTHLAGASPPRSPTDWSSGSGSSGVPPGRGRCA
ncbi:ArsR/SmtB family transcription factor [Nocardioides pyridinolyticus]